MVYNSAGVFKCLACATLAGRRKPGVFKETIMKVYRVQHTYDDTTKTYYLPSISAATAWNRHNFKQRKKMLIARIKNKLTLPPEMEGFDPGPRYGRITRRVLRNLNIFDYTDPEKLDFKQKWFLCNFFSDDSYLHHRAPSAPITSSRTYFHFSSWLSRYQDRGDDRTP
ncbi:MAG: hypothetical protein CME31_23150 [Gimesia sp.]|nr:hypothetical protein [Gimesia sp.]|tara:strand:- start:178 stop:681 length:504 start_codon:yes stop_codon:yes gene_type:complete